MTGKMRMRSVVLGVALGFIALPAAAFQETTVGGGNNAQAPASAAPTATPVPELPKAKVDTGKALNLSVPEVGIGKNTGTEVRIPGIGTVGVLPKLDFGLELLYGAADSKPGVPEEKNEAHDLQIRGTLKHRF